MNETTFPIVCSNCKEIYTKEYFPTHFKHCTNPNLLPYTQPLGQHLFKENLCIREKDFTGHTKWYIPVWMKAVLDQFKKMPDQIFSDDCGCSRGCGSWPVSFHEEGLCKDHVPSLMAAILDFIGQSPRKLAQKIISKLKTLTPQHPPLDSY